LHFDNSSKRVRPVCRFGYTVTIC